jgi:electron transfer flavoprotein alpha subunit
MPQGVLIVAEHRDGKIQGPTLEMIAKGRDLVSKHGGKLSIALFGQGVDALAGELVQYPVDQVLVGEHEALKSYTPEGYSQALKAVVDQADPLVILMAHTTQGYDFAPRLAADWNLPLASGCVDVAIEGQGIIVTRRVLNEKIAVDLEFGGAPKYIVTIRAATFKPAEKGGAGAQVQKVPIQIDVAKIIRKVIGVEKPQVADVDIAAADVVVAVGRGIGKKENLVLVQDLAKMLGGVVGASRPITDAEWLPKSRQVGQSGKTIKAKLYIGCGISGAMQHVAGMKDSGLIIAINTDPSAPIFEYAHYGIVGNVLEVLPALAKALKGG